MDVTHRSLEITRPLWMTARGRRSPQHRSTEPWWFPKSGHEKEEREGKGRQATRVGILASYRVVLEKLSGGGAMWRREMGYQRWLGLGSTRVTL
jgi:hypothetical protein